MKQFIRFFILIGDITIDVSYPKVDPQNIPVDEWQGIDAIVNYVRGFDNTDIKAKIRMSESDWEWFQDFYVGMEPMKHLSQYLVLT